LVKIQTPSGVFRRARFFSLLKRGQQNGASTKRGTFCFSEEKVMAMVHDKKFVSPHRVITTKLSMLNLVENIKKI
jgi:hypothetical protein